MPQPKQHASAAARQAAYRARCEKARQVALAAKGLPSLPAIASLPGWPRWRASFAAAREFLADTLSEMQGYYEDRSESWQEGDRGEEHQRQIGALEALIEALDELDG